MPTLKLPELIHVKGKMSLLFVNKVLIDTKVYEAFLSPHFGLHRHWQRRY
jgi:hypothetical protein